MKKIVLCILMMCFLVGCGIEKQNKDKVSDLEFTVVEDADVPEELKTRIEEKKMSEFKMTYTGGDYLYIVVGYGEQKTGGYSIAVNDLYLGENAIYIDTNLIGPSKDETVTQASSYPYVVVKIEKRDESVVFQ